MWGSVRCTSPGWHSFRPQRSFDFIMTFTPAISVLIPTWNNLEMLKLCVGSVRKHSELDIQMVVHVNEGSDGTLDWLPTQEIEFTRSPQNIGICRSLNAAYKKARADYIVYLNDDMYALPGWDRCLYDRAREFSSREPCYVSGTMVQASPISPVAVKADYGSGPDCFEEARLLEDFQACRFACRDWNGATWPPSCIHRKWWEMVGGYDEDLPIGFYSDLDFSMRLWQSGCRRFYGLGGSLVYHFSEVTTSKVRGDRNGNVRAARVRFLRTWGVLPSTFHRYYLRPDEPAMEKAPDAPLRHARWERLRLQLMKLAYSIR